MIKGIMALFTSGLFFDPMVLIGIVFGFLFAFKLEPSAIFDLYKDFHFYGLMVVIAFIYNVMFKKVYIRGGAKLDIKEMLSNVVLSVIKLVLASALSVSFVYMLSDF